MKVILRTALKRFRKVYMENPSPTPASAGQKPKSLYSILPICFKKLRNGLFNPFLLFINDDVRDDCDDRDDDGDGGDDHSHIRPRDERGKAPRGNPRPQLQVQGLRVLYHAL